MCTCINARLDFDVQDKEEFELTQKLLQEEQKKKKELASANVKLNGMLRVGQDAINAEQDLVKQLQQEVDLLKAKVCLSGEEHTQAGCEHCDSKLQAKAWLIPFVNTCYIYCTGSQNVHVLYIRLCFIA